MNILDKEEFRVKLGQINKLVETQDYKGAMQIVDSIDWRRVKNEHTLPSDRGFPENGTDQ